MLFGKVIDGEMRLNETGKIVQACWEEVPTHFPNVVLHESCVMPNHFHGIIEVGATFGRPNETDLLDECQRAGEPRPYKPSLGNIVGYFKYQSTKKVDLTNTLWQRNYYEHIVRDFNDYTRIAEYIINNPQNWGTDKYSIK